MLRYALDALGWYDFEGLIQSLLKSRLGLGVEAWGGTGDWGRDAYFSGALRYPTYDLAPGPFLFQSKFVDAANAAGANPEPSVLKAVRAERDRIKERLERAVGGKAGWTEPPATYVLFTNADLGGGARAKAEEILRSVLPRSTVHVHGGSDICAWLDTARDVARGFPQLLGLRDLEGLLSSWVNRDVLTRSRAALHAAAELVPVFVPTKPYNRAWETLGRTSFVVLEGPPEMGKTAIGRVIALSLVAQGWEALECRSPLDLQKTFKEDVRQIFVADDFFGRGEYSPSLVSLWQGELPHVLHLLDKNHWLVLTTRAHLLNIAKTELDLATSVKGFPKLGEVVVDAAQLTPLEKARILYRHLKTLSVTPVVREQIKAAASSIVYNPHFTPERIRRLASETLPDVLRSSSVLGDAGTLFAQALSDPTQGMRISFRKLAPEHKWLLFALTECESASGGLRLLSTSTLESAYLRLCPDESQLPFDEVVGAMSQAFIRVDPTELRSIRWVHPSCRDLAIDELARDVRFRSRFLEYCNAGGIELAIAGGGGSEGMESFRLIRTDSDWAIFGRRAAELIRSGELSIRVLWSHYAFLNRTAHDTASVVRYRGFLSERFWPVAVETSNAKGWTVSLLEAFYAACAELGIDRTAADAESFWAEVVGETSADLENDSLPFDEQMNSIDRLASLAKVFARELPSNAESKFAELAPLALRAAELAESQLNAYYDASEMKAEERANLATAYEQSGDTLRELAALSAADPATQTRLRLLGGSLATRGAELEPDSRDESYSDFADVDDEDVDVEDLFRDL